MPDNLKETLTLPVAIPTWGLATLIASCVFGAGTISHKLDTIVESSAKYEKKVDLMFERQVLNIANVNHVQEELRIIKGRLDSIERHKSKD